VSLELVLLYVVMNQLMSISSQRLRITLIMSSVCSQIHRDYIWSELGGTGRVACKRKIIPVKRSYHRTAGLDLVSANQTECVGGDTGGSG
jgi:hypothetical protein